MLTSKSTMTTSTRTTSITLFQRAHRETTRFFEIFDDGHAQPHITRFTYRRASRKKNQRSPHEPERERESDGTDILLNEPNLTMIYSRGKPSTCTEGNPVSLPHLAGTVESRKNHTKLRSFSLGQFCINDHPCADIRHPDSTLMRCAPPLSMNTPTDWWQSY